MFWLAGDNLVQLATLIVYAAVTATIVLSVRSKLKSSLLWYVFGSAAWCAAGLAATAPLFGESIYVKALVPAFSALATVTYAGFATTFVQRWKTPVTVGSYAWLGLVFGSLIFGVVSYSIPALSSPRVYTFYGWFLEVVSLGQWPILLTALFLLVRSLIASTDPEEKNRTAYLVTGLSLVVLVSLAATIMPEGTARPTTIAYAVNAILIAYALARYRLLSIQLVAKKWLVYGSVSVCMAVAYLGLLIGLNRLLPLLPAQFALPMVLVMVVLFACLFNWLRTALDKGADRLFYGKTWAHLKVLLEFGASVNNLINVDDIANALLKPLIKAVRARQAILMLAGGGYFAARFMAGSSGDDRTARIRLKHESSLMEWLEKEGRPLTAGEVSKRSEFAANDRESIAASQVEILCPIINKHRLIGILALGKRHTGNYSRDDMDMTMLLLRKVGAALENALAYSEARDRADTDELTGLRNHRYFQQRLSTEIDKCSRLEKTFSVLIADLDDFKSYNDMYGHVKGDSILREMGQLTKALVQSPSVAARYGGDEFAAIMPDASLAVAEAVAEGVRKQFAAVMRSKGNSLTCSIGVASWRTDGGQRGQIIDAADRALYHAKHAGGNQVCLARNMATAQSSTQWGDLAEESNADTAATVYALSATIDVRDHFTYEHSVGVARYATELATAIGYPKSGVGRIRAAAMLHDIGKLSLPDKLFTKSGALTSDEWEVIRSHPVTGVAILKYITGLRGCLDAIMFHHERYDGKGYPRGLKGQDIPLDARIMAVADAYDAITSDRCYRNGKLNEQQAITELERSSGTQFDPTLVKTFVDMLRKNAPATPEKTPALSHR